MMSKAIGYLVKSAALVVASVSILVVSPTWAAISFERSSTFTDERGGTAVTTGQGEFGQPGSEFNVTAIFTDFMPQEEGYEVSGQLNAMSNVSSSGEGLLSEGAVRSTVVNGDLSITSASGEVVNIELVDVTVSDGERRFPRAEGREERRRTGVRARGRLGDRRGLSRRGGDWEGTMIINGESMAPQEAPPKIKAALKRLLGLMRH